MLLLVAAAALAQGGQSNPVVPPILKPVQRVFVTWLCPGTVWQDRSMQVLVHRLRPRCEHVGRCEHVDSGGCSMRGIFDQAVVAREASGAMMGQLRML